MAASTDLKPGLLDEVYYPETDEEPMGETDFHAVAMILLREGLQDFFALDKLIYVASNLFLYYVQGNPKRNRSPDVMVVKGVTKRFRRVFKVWEEGAIPCTAFEIASDKTWREDLGPKRREYARIGVREYIIFDPEGLYLQPVLRGFRLQGRRYVPITPAADGSLVSAELGLRLVPEGNMLRLIDVRTGKPVLTRGERAEQAEQQSRRDRQRAEALAAEVERLRAELAQAEEGKKPGRRNGKKKPS